MAPRRALTWIRWAWAYRLSIWVVAFTTLTVIAGLTSYMAIERVQHEAALAQARDCLDAWERVDGSRRAIDESISGVLALAYAVSSPEQLTPERRAQIDAAAGPIVADAQAEIPEPDCDRDRARQRLAELQGAP